MCTVTRREWFSFHRVLELKGTSRSFSCAHWHYRRRNRSLEKWHKRPTVSGPGHHRIRTSVYFLVWFYHCFHLPIPISPKPIVHVNSCVDTEGFADTGLPYRVCIDRLFMLRVCLSLPLLWRNLWEALVKYRIKEWKYCYHWTPFIMSLNSG